jgi:hypothetical protein
MKKPKANPFRVSNSDRVDRLKLPYKSADQVQRDEKEKMRKSRTSDKAPSNRVPIGERKSGQGTQAIASAIMGGTPKEKSAYAKKSMLAATKKLYMSAPAKRGK